MMRPSAFASCDGGDGARPQRRDSNAARDTFGALALVPQRGEQPRRRCLFTHTRSVRAFEPRDRGSRDEIDDIFDSLDQDGSGTIEYHELKGLLESEANAKEFPKSPLLARNAHEEDEPMSWCQRKCSRVRRCYGVTYSIGCFRPSVFSTYDTWF